ncbi:MAG: hypothetical protein K2K64_08740 [Muribaculaceae bacterium]|nr:hypothetical protein [Muribaculaceae bacterium]MDE7108841.1 hypothetical protein [Muribaculaceae bacterium]
MKTVIFTILMMCIVTLSSYSKPKCRGFNNYDNKVTITFTDDKAGSSYDVSMMKEIKGLSLRIGAIL